ncbi:MAG: hypothetical protein ACHQX3_00115 [Nitrospirales bacterium]
MAKCMKCGSKYRMNSNRIPTCKTCRYKERELDSFVKWEEKLEASMGPKPDYVQAGGPQ